MALVTLFPTKYGPGFISPALTPEPMVGARASLEDAFTERFETDAHFVAYVEDDAPARRLNLSTLGADDGGRPRLGVLVADVDFPAHAEGWEDPSLAARAYGWIEAALERFPSLGVYSTLGGLRLVGVLAEPVEARFAASLIEKFHDELLSAGVEGLDLACRDWTRLYRLPYVVREGVGPVEPPEDLFRLPEGVLAWDYGVLEERIKPPSSISADYGPRPAGVPTPTGDPVPQGERHEWQLKAAGRYARLHRTSDAHEIYEEAVGPRMAASVYPGEDVEQVLDHAWTTVCYVAASHAPEAAIDRHVHDLFAARAERAEAEADEAFGVPWEDLKNRFVILLPGGQSYAVYDPRHDSYTRFTVRREHLPTLVERMVARAPLPSVASTLVETRVATEKGEKRLTPTQVFERYGRFASRVTYEYGTGGCYYTGGDEDGGEVVIGCCPIVEAEPVHDAEIDGWIEAFAGERADHLRRWLATVRRLDSPTCALYLYGGPGTGKTLFTSLVASLFGARPIEWERVAIGRFNDQLLESPIISADEPKRGLGAGSTRYRQYISGASIDVEAKGMPIASLRGCPRIVITANNTQALAFSDSLSSHDIEALTERTGIIAVRDESRAYLEDRLEDVRDSWWGHRFAAYVSWLEETIEVDTSRSRWLVAGWDDPLIRDISAHTSVAYEILAIIAGRIADGTLHGDSDGIYLVDGEIFVSPPHLRELWAAYSTRGAATKKELTEAIRTNSLDASTTPVKLRKGRGAPRRLWRLDPAKLASVAAQEGTFASVEEILDAVSDTKTNVPAPTAGLTISRSPDR